jgi:sulfite oxidase
VPSEPGKRLIHDPQGWNSGCWPMRPDQFITPSDDFYVRSHAPTPSIDPHHWRLDLEGLVRRPCSFSLTDLQRFPRHEVTATLVCAGLRRDELMALRPSVGELPWGAEPVGTGRWAGHRLRDLLADTGVAPQASHVEFMGGDQAERDGRRFGFGASIDLAKALSPEVLLATELNGAPLSPEHGFPLRAIVPGWIGARSVKWLSRITLLAAPSNNYFQARAYRVQREVNPDDPRDVSAGMALTSVPINSVILQPTAGDALAAGLVRVRGWAIGSGGIALDRLELSVDDNPWTDARLGDPVPWSWTLWQSEVRLEPGRHTLAVRATDCAGNTQPASVDETWNVKGYANNAWHRVTITVT